MSVRRRRRSSLPDVTTAFTATSFNSGLYGPVDTTTNTARASWAAGMTVWYGRINGKTATLTVASHANASSPAPFTVSVDGGAFGNVSTVSNVATLFSGLSDGWHTVIIRPGSAYGESIYNATSGNILSVTGSAPAVEVPASKVQTGKTGDFWGGPTITGTTGANFVPRLQAPVRSATTGTSVSSLCFNTSATKLYIVTEASYVAVSVDGAAPTYYANSAGNGVTVTCDGASHDYFVWDSGISGSGKNAFSVGADATLTQLGSPKRLHHFGHSIVEGISATSSAHTDMSRTAARKGYAFANLGISGDTIQLLLARMTTTLAQLTVTSADVAILDIGRNDSQLGFDAQDDIDFPLILSALVSKGYGKVLVLGQLTQTGFTPEGAGRLNEDISAAVTALGNPNVTYISRSAYTGISYAGDNTHPLDAGYVTMDTLNVTYIDPSL